MCLIFLLVPLRAAGESSEARGFPKPGPPPPAKEQLVLVLNSFQYGLPVSDGVNKGILAALAEGGVSVSNLYIQHLDLDRLPDREHRADLARLLRHKLAGKRFDIVITLGAQAVDFVTREGKDLFPEVTLFTLLNPDISLLSGDRRRVMNIPWHVDPAGTLRVALDLFPKTRRVFVIAGAQDRILPFLDQARKAFLPWRGKLDFEYSNEMTYEEMLRRISALPSDAIILYSTYFTDKSGRSFVPAEVVVKVSRTAVVPVFGMMETYLGRGIVGGSLLKTETIGKQAGRIAIDYLNGRLKLLKPVTSFQTPYEMIFDWRELTRWKADLMGLPKDSLVINRPLTLWGQYQGAVTTAAVVVLVLTLLIVAMLIQNRRLNRMKVVANNSEARFRVMVEHAPEAIVIYDIDLERFVDANARAERLFGCSREELLKHGPQHFYALIQPDGRPIAESMQENIARVLAGEEILIERTLHNAAGQDLACELRLVQLPSEERKLIRNSYIDITERKKKAEALRENERRLSNLMGNLPGMAYRCLNDKDWTMAFVSAGCYELFEYAPEDLINNNSISFNELIHPEDQQRVWDMVQASLSRKDHYLIEYRVYTASGKEKWVWEQGCGVFVKDGELLALEGFITDITERKKAEEENRRINEELEQRVRERTAQLEAFAYSVSHDLKAPLRGIDGYSRLLLEDYGPKLDGDGQHFVRNIRQGASQMTQLIDDLLAYSRLERRTMMAARINLPHFVETLLLGYADEIRSRQVSLQVSLPPLTLQADADGLGLALRNLIGNALKFTRNTARPAIEITGQHTKQCYILEVKDNGIGFDMGYHDRIFEIFQRLQRAEEYPGTGIGLALVRKAMERMGGRVWAESRPGEGTKFFLEVPIE